MPCSTGCRSNLNINALVGEGWAGLLLIWLLHRLLKRMYVGRLFSVCGDLTARKRNKIKGKQSFLEPSLCMCNAGQTSQGCCSQSSVTE